MSVWQSISRTVGAVCVLFAFVDGVKRRLTKTTNILHPYYCDVLIYLVCSCSFSCDLRFQRRNQPTRRTLANCIPLVLAIEVWASIGKRNWTKCITILLRLRECDRRPNGFGVPSLLFIFGMYDLVRKLTCCLLGGNMWDMRVLEMRHKICWCVVYCRERGV